MKPQNFDSVLKFVHKCRREGKIIVTTNGCFDILHIGHIHSLTAAKNLGDVLIVGVNSDTSVRKLKGNSRPVVPEYERAEVIGSLKTVDAVFIFKEENPKKWLAKLKPDIHVKGNDRKISEIIEKDTVEKNGGKIVLIPIDKNKSTTNIIEKIKGKNLK